MIFLQLKVRVFHLSLEDLWCFIDLRAHDYVSFKVIQLKYIIDPQKGLIYN